MATSGTNFEHISERFCQLVSAKTWRSLPGHEKKNPKAGNVATLRFGMKNNNNAHVYHLVYAARHPNGIKIMKGAIHKNSGLRNEFTLSESTQKQMAIKNRLRKKKMRA